MFFTEGEVISSFEIVLPKNVLESCYKLVAGEETEFLASNVQRRTTSRIKLEKQHDLSVRIKLAVCCWKEVETAVADASIESETVKTEDAQTWPEMKEVAAEHTSSAQQSSKQLLQIKSSDKRYNAVGAQQQTAPVEQTELTHVALTTITESEAIKVQKPDVSLGVMAVGNVADCITPQQAQNGVDQPADGIVEANEVKVESALRGTQVSQSNKKLSDPQNEDHKRFIGQHHDCGSGDLEDEMKQHSSDWTAKCKYCKSTCKNISNLYNHVRGKHSEEQGVNDYLCELNAGRKSTCRMCQKEYSSSRQLDTHMRLMHQEQERVKCSECDVTVKSKSHLKNHMRRSHTAQKQEFLCHLCPASFRNQSYLNDHLKHVHHKNMKGIHACSQCNFTTTSLKYLRGHQFRVHSGRRHVCPYCEKSFSLVPNMKRHIELLHSEMKKRFTCPECSKSFSIKANLKEHINSIHLKHFTFKCELCDMGFRRRKELEIHNEVHRTSSSQLQDLISKLGVQTVVKLEATEGRQEVTSAAEATATLGEEMAGECSVADLTQRQIVKGTELPQVQLILVTPSEAGQM